MFLIRFKFDKNYNNFFIYLYIKLLNILVIFNFFKIKYITKIYFYKFK